MLVGEKILLLWTYCFLTVIAFLQICIHGKIFATEITCTQKEIRN